MYIHSILQERGERSPAAAAGGSVVSAEVYVRGYAVWLSGRARRRGLGGGRGLIGREERHAEEEEGGVGCEGFVAQKRVRHWTVRVGG